MSNNWNGLGVRPLSGQKCVVEPHNTQWGFDSCIPKECKVLCYYNDFVWIDLICDGVPVATRVDKVTFKPIKSDRDKAIEGMTDIWLKTQPKDDDSMGYAFAVALYDAGYRKQSGE